MIGQTRVWLWNGHELRVESAQMNGHLYKGLKNRHMTYKVYLEGRCVDRALSWKSAVAKAEKAAFALWGRKEVPSRPKVVTSSPQRELKLL